MTKSMLIGLATAALIATTTVGAGVANALQVGSQSSSETSVQQVGYYWNGYWRPYDGVVSATGAVCAMRKAWVETPRGPRLKWVRVCRRDI